MLALYFAEELSLRKSARPAAGDDALIRVHLAGICNTDIEITRGYMGFRGILGHEFVGTVEACSDTTWIGKRVVGEINLACQKCPACHRGLQRHCPQRTVLGILNKDGAMAEYVTLPVANLHEVPASLADEAAVFTEPLAAACEIAEQVHLQPGTRALVLGDGKLGMLIVQVLRQYGCRVWLLGRHRRKLDLAAKWGVAVTADPDSLRDRFDLVVEATGAGAIFPFAVARTRPRGTLVLKSTYAGNIDYGMAPIVIDEISLIGSRCGPFAPALDMLASGRVQTQPLITAEFPLQEALTAFAEAQKPGVLKILLRIGE